MFGDGISTRQRVKLCPHLQIFFGGLIFELPNTVIPMEFSFHNLMPQKIMLD
jgi:hypothetical protein